MVTVDYNGKNLEKKGYFDIKAKSVKNSIGTLVDDSGTEYSIEKLKYDLKAKAYEGGNVEKGTVKIKGSIEGKENRGQSRSHPGKKDRR